VRVYALIPARSGSRGVPDKNIREIAGHPLLAYSIAFAQKIKFERIIVSTDSPLYQKIAIHYGADCPYLRGADASSHTAMEEDILADLAAHLPRLGIPMPDVWVRLKPTSPFRTVRSVETAIALLDADPELHSVRIISETESRLHVIDKNGYLVPQSPQWDRGRSVMRRDEFPRAYKPFNLDVLRHGLWVERGSAYMGERVKPVVEHKITGLDIDDEDDFELAKTLISIRPRPAFLEPFIHDPAEAPAKCKPTNS
jgi:CMP-N,N'-diacetyllegionaminic acid synthase